MTCPYCKRPDTNPRSKRTARGYKTFYCPTCKKTFNERTGSPFNKCQFETETIFVAVLWRVRYKLSLRDVAEMFLQRGFTFSHEAVREWEERFAPLIMAKLKAKRQAKYHSRSW